VIEYIAETFQAEGIAAETFQAEGIAAEKMIC
jgi:hypothetical protein